MGSFSRLRTTSRPAYLVQTPRTMSRRASCSGVKSRSIVGSPLGQCPCAAMDGRSSSAMMLVQRSRSGLAGRRSKFSRAAGRGERIINSGLPALGAPGPGVVVGGGGQGDAGDALGRHPLSDLDRQVELGPPATSVVGLDLGDGASE